MNQLNIRVNKLDERIDYIEKITHNINNDNMEIKNNIKDVKKDVQKIMQAINILYYQSGVAEHQPTYDPENWINIEGGNCYNYAINDAMFDWNQRGSIAAPGYTIGKSYSHEDSLNKIVMGIYADGQGRTKVVSHIKQSIERFVVPETRSDGFYVIYLISRKPKKEGYHFIREDKNVLNGSRQGWSHRHAGWDIPQQIEDMPDIGQPLKNFVLKIEIEKAVDRNEKEEKLSLLSRNAVAGKYLYIPQCVFFVIGNGFTLLRGTSLPSDELDQFKDKDLSSHSQSENNNN